MWKTRVCGVGLDRRALTVENSGAPISLEMEGRMLCGPHERDNDKANQTRCLRHIRHTCLLSSRLPFRQDRRHDQPRFVDDHLHVVGNS